MSHRVPALLTAHVVVIIQEVVLHLRHGGRKAFSCARVIETDELAVTDRVFFLPSVLAKKKPVLLWVALMGTYF